MRDLSWLKRPFDCRYVYVLGGLLGGMLFIWFWSVTLSYAVGWWIYSLVVILCAGLGYRSRQRRKHTVPRGVGWFAVGMIAGHMTKNIIQKEPIDFWTIGIILAFLAYALWKEWRERDLAEE